jgi:hypothetical protein
MPDNPLLGTAIIRQQALGALPALCRALVEALTRGGLSPEHAASVWRAEVAATCARCGITVTGAELLALSQPPAAETASAKTGRLRLGDCARSGCNSYHYLLSFKAHGQVNWQDFLSQADGIMQGEQYPSAASSSQLEKVAQLARRFLTSPTARRLWLGLAAVMLLMLAKQWYRGGTIPLIRQPEHFRVAPAAGEEAEH